MSDRQLAKELQARNVLAERIAAVLIQRQKIGAKRRAHECEYQHVNNDRALARYYRLRGGTVGQLVDGITEHSESVPGAVRDVHAKKYQRVSDNRCVVYFRWNSPNGLSV